MAWHDMPAAALPFCGHPSNCKSAYWSEVPFYGGPHPDQIDGHAMLLEVITGDGRPLRPERVCHCFDAMATFDREWHRRREGTRIWSY